MVQFIGFTAQERQLIEGVAARFDGRRRDFGELARIEKADLPGYDGMVVPVRLQDGGDRLEMTMYLSALTPFTIAHELAHVSDIATRRQDSLNNLSCSMPGAWHLAYKMSSEYYANRVACGHADESDILRAFKSDAGGAVTCGRRGDWGDYMVYYALLLGILHAKGRMDLCPLALLSPIAGIPEQVRQGMEHFRHSAVAFFDTYGSEAATALA